MESPTGGRSPSDILRDNVVVTAGEVALVLGLTYTKGRSKGEPNPTLARDLIRSGALAAVDPLAPPTRWKVTTEELRRFLSEGPRRTAA